MPELSRCGRCRRACRRGSAFLFSHVGLCSLVFGYTLAGALAFEALERSFERDKRREMQDADIRLVARLWDYTEGLDYINASTWQENVTLLVKGFETELVKAMRKDGFDGNNGTDNQQWTFSGAMLYSIIVITTIGYGNVAPKTVYGKLVTIVYAIVGIPLLLLCLSNIGDAMAHSFKFVYWRLCCYLCTSPPAKQTHRGRRHNRSNRSSRFPSEARTLGPRDMDSLGRGYGDSLDRHRNYTSPPAVARHSYYSSREAGVSDAYRVPIISNKYAMYPLEATEPHQQLNRFGDSSAFRQGGAIVRPPAPAHLQQEPMTSSFFGDEMSNYEDPPSISGSDKADVNVPITLCLSIVVGYICGGGVLFSHWEGWEYLDSCYFCFITLTTIGFGDFVPGSSVVSGDTQLALGLCSLYLLFGMALLAMSFNLVQEEVTKTVTTIGKRIGILSSEDDGDEDDDL